MTEIVWVCFAIEACVIVVALQVFIILRSEKPVIGALIQRPEYVDMAISVTDWRGVYGSPSGSAFDGSIAKCHIGEAQTLIDGSTVHFELTSCAFGLKPVFSPAPASVTDRTDKGLFTSGNTPTNAGQSKQIDRLHLNGVPHASAVAMIEADCSPLERRVVHMREEGTPQAVIAERLGITRSKVRRLEASGVDKILNAQKEPS